MDNQKIILILEGNEENKGHIGLDIFVKQLNAIQNIVYSIDCSLSNGIKNTNISITGLSHSSPATVEMEPFVIANRPDVRSRLINKLEETVIAVENNSLPDNLDEQLLKGLKTLIFPVGRTLKFVALCINNTKYDLAGNFAENLESYLSNEEHCDGTMEGMLEKLNVHRNANIFTIFPDAGPTKIPCHFPDDLINDALSAVKRKVAVSGKLWYRRNSDFPHRIEVESLFAYEDELNIPTFTELLGIAPNATGEIQSEDFIAEYRNDWQ